MSTKGVVLKRHKTLDVVWHPETCSVFKSAKEKVVVGKLVDETVQKLKSSDVDVCIEWGFKYDANCVEKKDVNPEEDEDEDEDDDEDVEEVEVKPVEVEKKVKEVVSEPKKVFLGSETSDSDSESEGEVKPVKTAEVSPVTPPVSKSDNEFSNLMSKMNLYVVELTNRFESVSSELANERRKNSLLLSELEDTKKKSEAVKKILASLV
jgi:hypothetical protein